MEHVRLIITAECVIIPRDGYENKPSNALFVESLEESILEGVQVCAQGLTAPTWRSSHMAVMLGCQSACVRTGFCTPVHVPRITGLR